MQPPGPGIEHLLRELAPQVLGAVIRRFRDFAAAEDAVQEALIAAALQWPRRRHAGQSARLADPGRLAAHDRSHSQRGRPPPRETAVVDAVARAGVVPPRQRSSRRRERGRHAGPALHVLPSGADSGVGDRADAARGRRPDHGRDRQRVPGARSDDGAADQPREADASRPPACRSAADARGAGASGSAPCCTCSTSSSTRATRAAPGPTLQRADLSQRGDPADAGASTRLLPGRRARSRGCWR